MASRTLALTITLTLAICASALGAAALGGKTYRGTTPSHGVTAEGHSEHIASVPMTLKVASNGKTVTVHFASSKPILYCETAQSLHVQTSKAAKIASSGSFTAVVDERFSAGPGKSAIEQVVTGKFSGHSVKGTIHTKAGGESFCEGSTSFSAHA